MNHPPRQVDGIEINKVADGYIIYQPGEDRVHYLNHTAAVVFEYCNGRNSPQAIAAAVGDLFDLAQPPAEAVADCLANLTREGLIF